MRNMLLQTTARELRSMSCTMAIALVSFFSLISGVVQGAGCHYGLAEFTIEGDPERWIVLEDGFVAKRSSAIRIYKGGSFYYFPKAASVPCHGPQCERRNRGDVKTSAMTSLRHHSFDFCQLLGHRFSSRPATSLRGLSDTHLPSRDGEGIFRPPRCV